MGNGAVVKAGDLQYMSAGSGVRHSEFNPSKTQPVHLLQIWLLPNTMGGAPRYAEKSLGENAKPNALTLLFAGKAENGAVEIRQDARIYFGKVDSGHTLSVEMAPRRHAWLHVIKGRVKALDELLKEGDGAAVSDATRLDIVGEESAEFLFFDLA
jgi:redox-sensitive bicupin YhaK (pirin superfamily)